MNPNAKYFRRYSGYDWSTDASHNPANADATPKYDEWGWDDYWDCADWVKWHKSLKAKYGLEIANEKFAKAFGAAGALAANYSCRSISPYFMRYAKENGFYGDVFEGIGILAAPIAGGTTIITSGSEAVGNIIENIGSALGNTTKTLKYALPALVVGLSIGAGFWVYNIAKKAGK